MAPLRCLLAEWQIVRVRLVRSRLGLWLVVLGAAAVGPELHGEADLPRFTVELGMLAAVLCVAFAAGSDADRAALLLTLGHPTTPLAVAAGRWFGATTAATLVVLVGGGVLGRTTGAPPDEVARAAMAGGMAAGAAAASALAAVWVGGNGLAGALFLYIALVSELAPDAAGFLVAPGLVRRVAVAVLECAPSLWRYRQLAAGHPGAWLHAALWMSGGVSLAAYLLSRRLK